MIRLALVAGHGIDSYSSAETGRGWRPGEARDVDPGIAAYLTSTFPGAFVAEAPAPAAAEPEHEAPAPEPRKSTRRRA
jgi:hypothetical protein